MQDSSGTKKPDPLWGESISAKQLTVVHSPSFCLMQTENLQPKKIYLNLEKAEYKSTVKSKFSSGKYK